MHLKAQRPGNSKNALKIAKNVKFSHFLELKFCLQKCLVCLHYAPELVSKIYLSRELDWFFLPFEKPSLIFGKRPEHDFSLRESDSLKKSLGSVR